MNKKLNAPITWVIASIIVVLIVATAMSHREQSPERTQRARAMLAELQTVKPGDLIKLGNDWEVVRVIEKNTIFTVSIRDHGNISHRTESASWFVDSIVRQTDTNYTDVCVSLIKRLAW